MPTDLALRRTLTVRAPDGAKLVLLKKRGESIEHVLMKAALWALYRPEYPDVQVEVPIGDTYKPDLVALRPPPGGPAYGDPEPVFWGEAGKVSVGKWRSLFRRFPDAHFALARWDERLDPHVATIRQALGGLPRTRSGGRPRRAPVDLVRVPPAVATLADAKTFALTFDDVERVRLAYPAP